MRWTPDHRSMEMSCMSCMIRLSLCSAEDIVISQFNVISLISFFLYSLCLPNRTLYGILARRAAESNLGPRDFWHSVYKQTEKKQTHAECRSETPNCHGCVNDHTLTSRFPRSRPQTSFSRFPVFPFSQTSRLRGKRWPIARAF